MKCEYKSINTCIFLRRNDPMLKCVLSFFSLNYNQYFNFFFSPMLRLGILAVLTILVLTEYNQSLSKELGTYSRITYCSNGSLENWDCGLCKQVPKLQDLTIFDNSDTDVHGYIGYSPSLNRILVVFRGTQTNLNWGQNLFTIPFPYNLKSCKGCQVHSGFLVAYLSVAPFVDRTVLIFLVKYPSAMLIVTGYSLGGALATLSSLDLQNKYNKVSDMYNYGCPRVGDKDFAKYFNDKIKEAYRVVHNRDIVPHISARWKEVFYNEEMTVYKICKLGQDKTCSDSLAPNYSVKDHTSGYWTGTCL